MITIANIIEKVEIRQPVLNKSSINDEMLKKVVEGVTSLDSSNPADGLDSPENKLSFVEKQKFAQYLANSKVGVIFIREEYLSDLPSHCIGLVVQSPYLAYASSSQLFQIDTHQGIHPSAVIAKTAIIADDVVLGANTVVGENVKIGSGTIIAPNVVIASDTQIGQYVRIHAGAVIGSEGFGYAPTPNLKSNALVSESTPSSSDSHLSSWERIAQLGRVVIGNHVRIGANTCIDRGAIDDTVIDDNVIIDNLVQIAHNVQIGSGTAIAAKTGIAGSTKIGRNCIIAGAVGITGHIEIADNVTFTGMTMVTKSINKAGVYSSGIPVMPASDWRRAVVKFRQLIKRTNK